MLVKLFIVALNVVELPQDNGNFLIDVKKSALTLDIHPPCVIIFIFFLFCFLGYVGLGTVGAATWWYLYDEHGPQVSFHQLVSSFDKFNYRV